MKNRKLFKVVKPSNINNKMVSEIKPKESFTRIKVDNWLKELGWDINEESTNCNVFTEKPKTLNHQKKLNGKFPDYVLYESETDKPIAIIEAKRKGESLSKALNQAIKLYAKPLNIKIVFTIDGTFVRGFYVEDDCDLTIDGEHVRELLNEKTLLRFIKEGPNIKQATEIVKHTREELIKVFRWANDLLRPEGLRPIDRFIQFTNILFIKIMSEIEDEREKNDKKRQLDKSLCWDSFSNEEDPKRMLNYINNSVLKEGFAKQYNHSDDIFQKSLKIKNPETVKLIVKRLSNLKLLNTDSEIKGDAFEYFLKSLASGNDMGEYFTPRHIVKLMVNLVEPKFGDIVYDPTCGTGGFLIEAFRKLKQTCDYENPKYMKKLKEDSLWGVEITDTYKIAKMNMIITRDGHNNIKQGDCLSPKFSSKEKYNLVLSNPPYSQETSFGNTFPIPTKQGDCIFIQHIILSLKERGRCAIIVPDGFLSEFRQKAFKNTRKYLLENCEIEAIISLPTGVFYPYAGAKTSILIFNKGNPSKRIWFYEINNDGFELTIHRKPIKGKNDIDDLLENWKEKSITKNSFFIDVEEINNNHYKLLLSEYKKFDIKTKKVENPKDILKKLENLSQEIKLKFEKIGKILEFDKRKVSFDKCKLKNLSKISTGGTPSTFNEKYWEGGTIPWVRSGELKDNRIIDSGKKITELGLKESNAKKFPKNTVLIALTGATTGKTAILDIESTTNQSVTGIYPSEKFISEYLWYYLRINYEKIKSKSYGRAQQHIRQGIIEDLEIILPDIKTQKEIVGLFVEIESLKDKSENLKKSIDELFESVLIRDIKI